MIEYLTQSPHFYDYVTYGVILLGAFNLFEIFFLLYNKSKVERSEERKLELKRLASTALITATEPADLLPRPRLEEEYSAYSEAIASVLDSFEGEVAEKAVKLLEQLEIDGHYRRLARNKTWYKRGNAIDILSSFKLRANREFFLAVFRSEDVLEVKYRIIYGLSFLPRDREDVAVLAGMLASLPYLTAKYTEDIFYNVISALKAASRGEEFVMFMQDLLGNGTVPPLIKRDVLTACYAASCEKGRKLIKDYYRAYPQEPEILIAAIKSLARIGDFTFIPEAMAHPDWRVRMTALRNADLCCSDMLKELRALLRDSSYHVRISAALTLAKGGENGVLVLKEEVTSGDRFASEAAAYGLTQVTS